MNTSPDLADHVAVEVASTVAGIPTRTLRHWIARGKLAAIAGKRGKLVSMGEVHHLAELTGKVAGKGPAVPGNPATSADALAGNLATDVAVSPAARQQLALVRDEWLAPLVAELTAQAERIGRLEAELDAARAQLAGQESPQAGVEGAPAAPGGAGTPARPPGPGSRWRRLLAALRGNVDS